MLYNGPTYKQEKAYFVENIILGLAVRADRIKLSWNTFITHMVS
jgi:hypothetical protein